MDEESKQLVLGVDGGATKTQWMLCRKRDGALFPIEEGRLGPGSLNLLDAASLRRLLENMPKCAGRVGIFLAGCATQKDRAKLRGVAAGVWPGAYLAVGGDRESGFAAAFGEGDGIAVIAGTGSAVTGRRGDREARAGGWGHLLGDTGGGYDLAISALREVLFEFDTGQRITPLARDFLRVLGLNTLRDLTTWAQAAHKSELARLTPVVFAHSRQKAMRRILAEGAEALAILTTAVAKRLGFANAPVRLMGGVFFNQPLYVRLFAAALAARCPRAEVAVCQSPPALGAALLASDVTRLAAAEHVATVEPSLDEAITERSNPRSRNLDRLPPLKLVKLFVREERCIEPAVAACAGPLAKAVEMCAAALSRGGRLFYVGAGTSGRLGVLDSSEMPPTFGVPPDRVQAIIAGGPAAIQQSVEGAEDDDRAGAQAVKERGVSRKDVVCGITASGRTPFVRGALDAASSLGARTILITCNPARPSRLLTADIAIDLPTGPELITGSTRLKAGSATKVALNILSSCTMIRLGRVDGNAMAFLQASNEKLKIRAARIVAARLGIRESRAREHLECTNWNIQSAIKRAVAERKKADRRK